MNVGVRVWSRCQEADCRGLLRPAVVWFGESLDSDILQRVEEELDSCDLCLVVSSFEVGEEDVLLSTRNMFFSLCVNFW